MAASQDAVETNSTAVRHDVFKVTAATCGALFVDSLLYSIVVPVLPNYADQFDVGSAGVSLLYAAYAVALLAGTPLMGRVGDRFGHERPFQVGAAGLLISTVGFALARSYPELLAARTLQGVAAAALWTNGIALLAQRVRPPRAGGAMGAAMSSMSVGMVAGPVIGGLLAERFGDAAPFVVCTVLTAVLAAVLPWLVRGAAQPVREQQPSGWRSLLPTLLAVAFGAATLSMLEPLLPLHLADRFGSGPATLGLIFGAATLAHGLAGVPVGLLGDRRPDLPLIPGGLLGMSAVLPLLPRFDVGWTTVLLVTFAVCFSFVLIPALGILTAAAERRGVGHGAIFAMFNIAYAVGMMSGPLLGALGTGFSSVTTALTGMAAVLVLGAVLILTAAQRRSVT
ncbi:arabinose efflux permease family protein [Frankia casuarinae]|uniref:Major facilitator superfamily MFS_1 n=2 Tax=Frankia casuarinae (strain DSM 45818 / CECT 9043 / HFP020203 / CcI3) TaxID=106370 RepID=Q2J803_FRACC|nr:MULTISPECIES: MFS transporter [Frankia]ABD12589.1 major facilitator superfamily MFS_1 [Frankia casuarinae]ETA00233.1 arabinose efflux permease family protein [Frankia sp. CcI6]EYT90154.1 arabinose efflux permease family protein [Frankia casuarinae]KDA41835.1 arabinose efflux permease family protein [Frankia sp. BMG5.23]OFB39090.1 hypothetical protein Manayef4_20895 [Frankia sp. CgIM4]